MKILILVFGFIIIGCATQSQMEQQRESWQVKWNNKTILEAGKENESENVVSIDTSHMSKKTCLEVIYKESDPAKEKELNRSFLFFGDSENELLRKENTRDTELKVTELKKLLSGQTKIRIYTIAIPTDPDLAARVRVRRVHLATLELK